MLFCTDAWAGFGTTAVVWPGLSGDPTFLQPRRAGGGQEVGRGHGQDSRPQLPPGMFLQCDVTFSDESQRKERGALVIKAFVFQGSHSLY